VICIGRVCGANGFQREVFPLVSGKQRGDDTNDIEHPLDERGDDKCKPGRD